MKNSKLLSLLSKLEELSIASFVTHNDFFMESLNDELSRNLKGGVRKATNNTCISGTNISCTNSFCQGSSNVSCQNLAC
nr:hypothetical protein [Mucilaginibacter sp. X5P1]